MIYPVINRMKYSAIKHPMVAMAAFGSIGLFEDKADIKYPYVNFDVVNSNVTNYVKTYIIRIYVCDRNDPYTAYNKTETILDDLMKELDITSYTTNFFTLDFADVVDGVFVDFEIQTLLGGGGEMGDCNYDINLSYENETFISKENGDLIMIQ